MYSKHRQSPPPKPEQLYIKYIVSCVGRAASAKSPHCPQRRQNGRTSQKAVLVRPVQMMSGRSCDRHLASADQLHVLLRSRRRVGLRSCCRGLALSPG